MLVNMQEGNEESGEDEKSEEESEDESRGIYLMVRDDKEDEEEFESMNEEDCTFLDDEVPEKDPSVIIELSSMAAPVTISSQVTQTLQSSPMAFAVNTVSPVEQVQTANVETEEEKLERKWLDLLNHQMNFSLGLIAHATTSRCTNEVIKANVLGHLGRVMY
ncbi:hypothetical protein ACROYT_G014460 [Oculina patagonica]